MYRITWTDTSGRHSAEYNDIEDIRKVMHNLQKIDARLVSIIKVGNDYEWSLEVVDKDEIQ